MNIEEFNELLEETGEVPCMSAPDVFFPETEGGGQHVGHAKKLCGLCPIRVECADFAISNRERYGIWGGLTWNDRKKLIQRNNWR